MSKVPWHFLKNSHPRPHLLAGTMKTNQILDDSDLNRAHSALERFAKRMEPTGNYAITVVRDAGRSGVHLAFELESDSGRFAAAVNAEVSEGYPGWTTQQSLLSAVTETALLTSHPLPRTKRPPQNTLKPEVYLLGQMIESNAFVLASKTMNDDDQEALQRQMATRIAHLKLLQKRLDRLSN